MSAKIDTTPDYPEQPLSLVEAAERDLPAVLQDMPNETGSGADDPGHGHRVVLAQTLVEAMAEQGHSKAAAAYAVHRLIQRGLLTCKIARWFFPRIEGYEQVPDRVMFGVQRYRKEPVYGTTEMPLADPAGGPVPYQHLLVYSTEQLWQWWRSIKVMPPTDPDMDGILRQVQAKRQKAEAAEQLYQDQLTGWKRLRDSFQAAARFSMQDHAADIGRAPTRKKFYRAWAEKLAFFGQVIREQGLVDCLENQYKPDTLDGQWTRGIILLASKTPEDVEGLQKLLEQSGAEPELHAFRHRLRDVGEQLLKEASSDATLIAATEPMSALPPEQVADDLPDYKVEEQPWHTSLPTVRDMRSEELVGLADEIDLVVITATEPELQAVLRCLGPYSNRRAVLKGFVEQDTYYLGKFGNCRAVVTKCRMGSLDSGGAILATQHAQQVWRPRAVVMVGIAFGKDPAKQQIADVLVASQVISYEPQRVGEEQVVFRGPIPPSSPTLLNRFENVPHWSFCRPDGSKCERHVGPLLSGEKLVDDPGFKAELFHKCPQAIGGDMEGVGLAAAAVRHGVPWIIVKAICEWADGKKHKEHQSLAAAAAVSLVHHVLAQTDVLHGLEKPVQA